jgi:hypothetical protein
MALARTLCSEEELNVIAREAEFLLHMCKKVNNVKFTASNTLLNSAEYAIKRKEHFSFLAETSCQDTATVTYPDPPSPAQYQCTLQLRGPETVFGNILRNPGIDSQPGGIDSSESITGLFKRLQIRTQVRTLSSPLCLTSLWYGYLYKYFVFI